MKSFFSARVLILVPLVGGCDQATWHQRVWAETCVAIGICEPVTPPSVLVSLLCDASAGASCDPATLEATVSSVVGEIVEAPGSMLEIWVMGSSAAETQKVAEFRVPASSRNGLRAIQSHQEQQMRDALELVRDATADYFASNAPSRSPIIGSLAKIALLTPAADEEWDVLILSDLLEYSDGNDFECAPPRDPEEFVESILSSGILIPDALRGARLVFTGMTLGPIDSERCSLDISRVRRIQELWTLLLTSAGAEGVEFSGSVSALREPIPLADEES